MSQYVDLIKAEVVADSISHRGYRMTTMVIEYPRFVLAELNTHRMLSKNSASSRAIPVSAMHNQICNAPAGPVHWGRNQSGMQAETEIESNVQLAANAVWQLAMQDAIKYSKELADLGVHKQISNRITEPWMTMRTVISGTEWNNLWWLRCHRDAQPEFQVLANRMEEAYDSSIPQFLDSGEWHLPFVSAIRCEDSGTLHYYVGDEEVSLEDAKLVSVSCCAQVSYRKTDDSLDKARKIFSQLIESEPVHASPVEHQCTPMDLDTYCNYEPETWEPGVTHVSANGDLWSGNLRGWIQYRKTIPNEAHW